MRPAGRRGGKASTPGARSGVDDPRDTIARLEERLRESEERFQSIIDANADGIVLVDDDGRIRFVNPAAQRLFGRSAEALLGEMFGYTVDGDETTEIDIVRRDGPPVVAEMRTVSTTWEGQPACVVSLRDVTDRLEAEARARELEREQGAREAAEEEARRAALVAETGGILDESLDYQETLPSLARRLVAELADWCAVEVIGPEDGVDRIAEAGRVGVEGSGNGVAAPPAELRRAALEGGEPVHLSRDGDTGTARHGSDVGAVEGLFRDGVRAVLVVPMVAAGEALGTLTLVRVGDRPDFAEADVQTALEIARSAAHTLKHAQLYQEARQANQAKADFLAVISHELRTPLNAVTGYVDLLRQGIAGELSRRQRRYLDRVDASARHLLQLVEEILSFARTESGQSRLKLGHVDLAEVAVEVADAVDPVAEEKRLVFDVDIESVELVTDEAKVRQVMLNLLFNAVKFTPRGTVRFEVRSEGEGALVRVSDTGIGIPEDQIERIFEPFWQVEQAQTRTAGGTGLGLSIVKQHLELLGGEIEVESEIGKGTRMTVRLPSAPEARD